MKKMLMFIMTSMLTTTIMPYKISFDQQPVSHNVLDVQINIALDSQETILKQTMSISLDTPQAKLGTIAYQRTAQKKYVPLFDQNKDIFENNVAITVPVHTTHNVQPTDAHLHISFVTLPNSTMHEQIYKISFDEHKPHEQVTLVHDQATAPATTQHATSSPAPRSFTEKLQQHVQNNDNLWFRLLLSLLLGLLLSLTPCIYPMIPITIGVLHNNQQGSSLFRHFLTSLCYALGLSTTFACLGLLAAFAGASFGSLLSNPFFVIFLVIFIGYMSLTMIGVIDLALPSFLQRGTQVNSKFGPLLSVFLFGLISGSVASPCVSPGLALLLTIVATMGSALSGFLLLFCFGIGMSIPLMIIGTFSSSMNLLPQAGQWMVEVKKALGFVMLATCLYYLHNITPCVLFNWLIVAYLLFAALFYIIDAQKDFDKQQKTIKSLLGIVLLAITVVMGFRAYDRMHTTIQEYNEQGVRWADSYDAALKSAQADNKIVLLDFWANHCTICKAIDKKLFKKDIVWQQLQDKVIFIKVDCTTNSNSETNMLKSRFNVFAQPTILLVNPDDERVLQKWSSEPYSMSPDEFIATIQKFTN